MKIFSTSRRDIIIAIVVFLVLFIPTLVAGILYYRSVSATSTQGVYDQRETAASLAASAVRIKLQQLTAIVQIYASEPEIIADVAAHNWNGAKSVIMNLQNDPKNYDYYIGRFLLLDTQGNVKIAYPGISSEGIGQPDDAISEIKGPILENGADSFVTDVFQRSVYPKNNHIEILVPVRKASVMVGVMEVTIPINEFSDFGKDIDIGNDGFVYIVDRLGHIITHPKYSSDGPIIDYSSIPTIQKVMQGQSGATIAYNSIEREERVAAYEPVPTYGWGIISQEPVSGAFATRDGILYSVIYMIAALGALELISAGSILFLLRHPHHHDDDAK
jgi:hypothetical protein